MPTSPTPSNVSLPPTPGTVEEVPLVLRDLIVQLQTALADYGTTINSLVDGQFNAVHYGVADVVVYGTPGTYTIAAPEGVAIVPLNVTTVSPVDIVGIDSTYADKGQIVWLTNHSFIQPFQVKNNVTAAAADRLLTPGASFTVGPRTSVGFWRMPADFHTVYPEGRWVNLNKP